MLHLLHRDNVRGFRPRATCWTIVLICVATIASPLRGQPLTPFDREKAEWLLQNQYSCLGCHRLGKDGGMLAPSLTDVRSRRDAGYITSMIIDPARTRPGVAMPKVTMPLRDRTLIIRYLGGTLPAAPSGDRAAPATPVAARVASGSSGASLYATWCAGCHGAAGAGNGPNARSLPVPPARHADSRATAKRTDDYLYDIIAAGGVPMGRSARMPAFGASLSPAEVQSLVRYIRTLCRCEAPAWSKDGQR